MCQSRTEHSIQEIFETIIGENEQKRKLFIVSSSLWEFWNINLTQTNESFQDKIEFYCTIIDELKSSIEENIFNAIGDTTIDVNTDNFNQLFNTSHEDALGKVSLFKMCRQVDQLQYIFQFINRWAVGFEIRNFYISFSLEIILIS